MKKIKKYIIILIIMIIILFTFTILFAIFQKEKTKEEFSNSIKLEPLKTLNLDFSFEDYITINNCVDRYLYSISEKDNTKILNLLSQNYIKDNKITKDNVFDKINNVDLNSSYYSSKIYELDTSISIKNYFVFGYICNNKTEKVGKKEELNFVVNMDFENNTFSIAPYGEIFKEYVQYGNDKVEIKNSIDYDKMAQKINKNDDNNIILTAIEDKQIARLYFNLYIQDAQYYREDAYNSLNEEFKQKRFNNFEKYNSYLDEIVDTLKNSELSKYKITYNEEKREIICLDNYDRYYIIKEESPMQYNIILDQYTLEIPEVLNKYNNLETEQKVAVCVNTFFDMINNKDYESAYNKLNNSFKNKNFKNLNEFKKYIKDNFFDNNKATYSSCEESEGVYIIHCSYENIESSSNKNKDFVVKLKEGMDFEMSFNID